MIPMRPTRALESWSFSTAEGDHMWFVTVTTFVMDFLLPHWTSLYMFAFRSQTVWKRLEQIIDRGEMVLTWIYPSVWLSSVNTALSSFIPINTSFCHLNISWCKQKTKCNMCHTEVVQTVCSQHGSTNQTGLLSYGSESYSDILVDSLWHLHKL